MKNTKRILVSRFSAMGDVAIAVPVLAAFLQQNPDTEIFLLTKPPFAKLFRNIERLTIVEVDLQSAHKGVWGIRRLCRQIAQKYKIDYYADLHNVLRTKLIHAFLPLNVQKARIDKGRRGKHLLTRRQNKKMQQLKHSGCRYGDVFRQLGFALDLSTPLPRPPIAASKNIAHLLALPGTKIGIAPFAKHLGKTYPIEKMQEVVRQLSQKYTVLVFGGGKQEQQIVAKWEDQYANLHSAIGQFSMPDEIALLNNCRLVVTMDSGNMHLAALTKTRIISIWGATHPFAGFAPFDKPDSLFVQKELDCRPCSVFGNKDCYKGTWECLDIEPETIIRTVKNAISNN